MSARGPLPPLVGRAAGACGAAAAGVWRVGARSVRSDRRRRGGRPAAGPSGGGLRSGPCVSTGRSVGGRQRGVGTSAGVGRRRRASPRRRCRRLAQEEVPAAGPSSAPRARPTSPRPMRRPAPPPDLRAVGTRPRAGVPESRAGAEDAGGGAGAERLGSGGGAGPSVWRRARTSRWPTPRHGSAGRDRWSGPESVTEGDRMRRAGDGRRLALGAGSASCPAGSGPGGRRPARARLVAGLGRLGQGLRDDPHHLVGESGASSRMGGGSSVMILKMRAVMDSPRKAFLPASIS